MKKPNNGITGIYKITNPNGKVYIGQSINVNVRKRHYKGLRCKDQPSIYNSLKKYGWENHKFEIIEECSMNLLNEREIFWKTDSLSKVNYNWNEVLFCNLFDSGGGPKSEEHRKKIGEGNRGKKLSKSAKDKISKIHKGAKRSEETKRKISEAKKGCRYSKESSLKKSKSLTGKKKSKQHRENISKAMSKPVIMCDLEGNILREFKNAKQASIILSFSSTPIGECCRNNRDNYKGYKFKYKNEF